jgi:hypothetical protein
MGKSDEHKERPTLGQKVKVNAIAHPSDGRVRKWESYPCEPFVGTFVGVRFKRNGYTSGGRTDWEGEYDPPFFVCKEAIEVWLVVDNPYHEPKCVLPGDCEWMAELTSEDRPIYYIADDGPGISFGNVDHATELAELGCQIITEAQYKEAKRRIDKALEWAQRAREADKDSLLGPIFSNDFLNFGSKD